MSSSRSGQWIPRPSPMKCQRDRSSGLPCQSRGYQVKGTDNVRPSASRMVKESSVTTTSLAEGTWISVAEELIPTLQKSLLMIQDDLKDLIELLGGETSAPLQVDWIEPELRLAIVTPYMDVRRLIPVARVEEEAIRSGAENSGHRSDLTRAERMSQKIVGPGQVRQ